MAKTYNWTYLQYNWTDLSNNQKAMFETLELDLLPIRRELTRLLEAEMTASQINATFANAETISRDKGLRTGFGKVAVFPKETMQRINGVLSDFGKKLQNSQPVKNIDEKFSRIQEVLRSKLERNEHGQHILALVDSLGNFARAHPNWQGAIIGFLTAISGLALGPAAIPVIAALLKGATELVKGELLSTAVGKGLYAGALGYLGAQLASAFMGYFESIRISNIASIGPAELGFRTISLDANSVNTVDGMQWTRWFKIENVTVEPVMRGSISDAVMQIASGDLTAYDRLVELGRRAVHPDYLAELRRTVSAANMANISNDAFLTSIRTIGKYVVAAAGGAATMAADIKPTRSVPESKKLTLPIMEGLWADLTLQFGAGKLIKAWNQSGKPTDSVEIAKMLANMGMTVDDISASLMAAGLSADDTTQTIKDLQNDNDDDLDIPFISGFKRYDDEAKEILKNDGLKAFRKYWEVKLSEFEKDLEYASPPTDTISATPNTPDISPRELFSKVKDAINAKDVDGAISALSSVSKISTETKTKLLGLLTWSSLGPDDRKEITAVIKNATITEGDMFDEITEVLKKNKLSWKSLGYKTIVRERRSDSVILL